MGMVARILQLWILVRQTNPESLKYIGVPGFRPKPINCKAKTASRNFQTPSAPNGVYELAGLVVDPFLCPYAFVDPAVRPGESRYAKQKRKLLSAQDFWLRFAPGLKFPPGYALVNDPSSPHYGAVTLHGDFVHGDYDLYDIVQPGEETRNQARYEILDGEPHMRGELFDSVQPFLNTILGVDMILHGGEMQYAGKHSRQAIEVFSPDGVWCRLLDRGMVVRFYKTAFKGRKPLRLPH
jgi:hypothetical protein